MNHIERLNAIAEPENQIFKNIEENGTIEFRNIKGELHNINDEPAVILYNGTKAWYKNGKFHRDNDKPSIINSYGFQAWYYNDQLHRNNGKPAIIHPNGSEEYWVNGEKIK